jgi:putative DNA primase/helicase
VPFAYERKARVPRLWRTFLKSLWPKDSQSRKALAQWAGYTVSGRLDLQKILLLIGPTRAGKGVIARLLGALIGPKNVAGPTLSSLAGDFGLAPLIGKSLAVISDARLSGRHGSVVVERLLSISGEDYLTVNIKYREQWTGKLPCRLVIVSNELPEFGDASAAVIGRFLVLTLATSWLGKEDIELETRLRSQLPGLLNWALMGLAQLEQRCRFTQPTSSDEAISSLRDLASPVRAFIRDRCEVHPDHQVPVDELYTAYRTWADDDGHPRIAKPTFGRNLKAAMPRVHLSQLRCGDVRVRVYVGLKLKRAASDE